MDYHLEAHSVGDCGDLKYEGYYSRGKPAGAKIPLSELVPSVYPQVETAGGADLKEPIQDLEEHYSVYITVSAPDAIRPNQDTTTATASQLNHLFGGIDCDLSIDQFYFNGFREDGDTLESEFVI